MKKMKAKLLPLLVAAVMVFAMAPLGSGTAHASGSSATLSAPTKVTLEPELYGGSWGVESITEVVGSWKAVKGATGYILTPCKVQNGKWTTLNDAITIDAPYIKDGTVIYDELYDPLIGENWYGGVIGFKVRAYNASGVKSAEVKSNMGMGLEEALLNTKATDERESR